LLLRQSGDIVQDPIDSEADARLIFIRLDMDIAGPAVHGLEEDSIDELYCGRLVRNAEQVLGPRLDGRTVNISSGSGRILCVGTGTFAADGRGLIVTSAYGPFYFRGGADNPDAGPVKNTHNCIISFKVERLGQGNSKQSILQDNGDGALAFEKFERQFPDQVGIQLLGRD
jgi:hypothetical protein